MAEISVMIALVDKHATRAAFLLTLLQRDGYGTVFLAGRRGEVPEPREELHVRNADEDGGGS